MSKAMKLYNQYEIDMLLKSKADYNNFYKNELVLFLNRARELLKENDCTLENTILKKALNEIREYCNNPLNWKYTDHYLEKDDILKIIDKVLGGSDEN